MEGMCIFFESELILEEAAEEDAAVTKVQEGHRCCIQTFTAAE